MSSSAAVSGVLAALHAIHDGATPHDQRLAASRFCDEFRALGYAALPAALELAAPSMNDQARHFGLQTLIGIVDRYWNKLGPADKQTMMTTSLSLVQSGSSGDPAEPRFVRQMIARLVVDIAAREWPQQWPTLHTDLLQVSQASVAAQHLTVLVFSALAELIVMPTVKGRKFLPERRRTEIRTGLEAVLADVNAFLIRALQSGQQPLVLAAFHCVTAYADWASPSNLVAGRIMSALAALFVTPTYFEAAAEPLLRLCARKAPSPASDEFAGEIGTVWKATVTIATQLVRSTPFPDQLRLVKIAVDLLAVLAKYHRAELVKSEQMRNMFLSLLGDLLKPDDAEIGIVVLSIWNPLLKASGTSSSSPTNANNVAIIPADQRQPVLRELFVIAITRFLATPPNPVPAADDADADDDAAQLTRQYQKYRSSILDLVKIITVEVPLMALQLTAPHVVRLLSTPPADHLTSAGAATTQTSTIQQLQACCVLLNALLDTAPFRQANPDPALLNAQQSLLTTVLNAAPQDPQVLQRQAYLLALFHDVLGRAPSALQAVIDKLLWMNGFVPERATDHDALVHQRRALASVVVIARKPACASQLLKWFADLSPMMLALCKSRPAHAPALLEVLVTICNALPSATDRINYVVQLIRGELSEFAALDMRCFLQLFGLSTDRPATVNLDEAVSLRDDRYHLLMIVNTIQYVFRSVTVGDAESQQVLYGALSGLCSNACAILSTIHALFSPVRLADATPAARAVFDPWTAEGDRLAAQADPARKDVLESLRTQLYAIRDQCYLLLQSALSCPFVFSGDLTALNLIIQTCLSDACLGVGPDALHRSGVIPILSKVWSPFLDKCPIQHPMFLFVMSRLINVLSGRLSQQWASVVGGDVASDGVGIDREVFEENALRECTRALMSTIQSALSPHNWVAFSDVQQTDKTRDSACKAVCDDPALAAATINVLHLGLQVPDSVTQTRAAALIARLLPTMTTAAQARDLFVPILETCLRLLSGMTKSVASSSSSGQDLMGLTFEILRHFSSVDHAPFDVLLRQPRVVKEEAEALRETLKSSTQATKAMRAATRTFIFAYITERDDSSSPVQDLPSHLVLPERQQTASEPNSPMQFPDLFS